MFAKILFVFAFLAVALAAPKPGVLAPLGYSAYSAYSSPIVAAAPLAYSAGYHGAYGATPLGYNGAYVGNLGYGSPLYY